MALACALALLAPCATVQAGDGEPLHSSGDKQLWHRKENVVELFGHAVVSQPGETLTADYVTIDLNSRVLHAKGNCVYVSTGNVIYGEEMIFNLDTRTGTIIGGRVSNSRFTLSGERINKLGEGRFQTHWGEYSTCIDCPNAWSIAAEDVDMQIEGYAFMNNVTPKINDAPAFWLPYLVMPMKTRRQTGFLFPTFSYNSLNGLQLVLPFFWAINDSADMTLAAGSYTERGTRLEWEGRYALTSRSEGRANFYFLRDASFKDVNGNLVAPNRFALDAAQTQELPWGFTEKLRLTEVSDNLYPTKVGDVAGSGELNLASSLSVDYSSDNVSAYVAARRYRTLINTLPDPALSLTQFDPRTVQEFPVANVTTNDRLLFGSPFVFGLSMGVANFTRSRDAFDFDSSHVPFGQTLPVSPPPYTPGVDPIRKGTRASVTPSLYSSFRPFDLFALTPSLRYYYYWYTFPQTPGAFEVSNLSRGYLLFQTDLSAQLERVYEFPDDKSNPRTKHLIRPLLTYSYIPGAPFLRESPDDHPFLRQMQYATDHGFSGYNFDDYDIVPRDNSPLTSNYFIPLGNSLNLGMTTQWIRRSGAVDSAVPFYTKFIDASFGEAINFREFEKECDVRDPVTQACTTLHDPQPFSRFFNTLDLNFGPFTYSHLYYYYPYISDVPHVFSSVVSYAFTRGVHQGLYVYDRSISMTYAYDKHAGSSTNNLTLSGSYSLSDYFLPTAYLSYNLITQSLLSAGGQLQFQSPARCWKFTFNASYDINVVKPDSSSFLNGFNFNIDLALNITGSGFGGITEMATQTNLIK